MQAGKLRTRINIMRKTEGAQDEVGAPTITWSSLGMFSAQPTLLRGFELQTAQQRWGEVKYRFDMRFHPGTTFRVADGISLNASATEPEFDIIAIDDPDMRRRCLHIYVRELKS